MSDNLIEIKNLTIVYKERLNEKKVLDSISFKIPLGETFGLIGESGSGKSTLGKAILQLISRTEGSIKFQGEEIRTFSPFKMQMIFQNPYGSVNPRMTISQIIREPLLIHKKDDINLLKELIELTELPKDILSKYPKELSGGQLQRVGIARALMLNPQFIFCDEPTSSLDIYHEQKIVELLLTIQKERKLTYLWVSHNLPLISTVSNTIAVIHCGKIIEMGFSKEILRNPKQPYTKSLISSLPIPDPILERQRKLSKENAKHLSFLFES